MGRLATIVMLLGVALLAGCSTFTPVEISRSYIIDSARVEDTIGRDLKEGNPVMRVGGVACPEGIETAEGATFQCTAEVGGVQAPITVTVTQVDTSTGEFKYDWKLTKAILVIDQIVTSLKSQLRDQAPNATVDCGAARVQVVEVGGAIDCTISEGSERQVVRGVVEDVDGTVRFEQQD
jgi:hypothetical protein